MPALSDQAWTDICAAAGCTPESKARAVLSALLFEEYPAFAYDRGRVAAALKRSGRMLKALGAFEEEYRAHFPADNAEHDLSAFEGLRRRAEAVWLAGSAIQRATARRKNARSEFLVHKLCDIWLAHFGAGLTYSVPNLGGRPSEPLLAFLFAALRQVVQEDALPSLEALRDGVVRERHERENARQLMLQLRRRMTD